MSYQSADLNGTSQTFSLADPTNLNPGSGDFSIGGWVKCESQGGSGNNAFALVDKYYQDTNQREYRFTYEDNVGTQTLRLRTSSAGSSGFATATINQTLNLDQWYHIAFSVDISASTVEMFVDGSSIGTGSTTSSIYDGTSDFSLGSSRQRASNYMDGKMANWRYFSADLTAAEWTTEMNSPTAVRANCEGDWSLDGDATDASSNSYDLTNYNTTPFVNDNGLPDISLYGDVEGTDYVKMTVNSSEVDATLTDYPVYLDLSQIGTSDNFWSTVLSTGADIVISDSTGATQYPLEVVEIDTTAKTGVVYFKMPSLSSSVDTDIRVYYDGVEGARDADALYGQYEVWSDYSFVWHGESVNESTSGQHTLTASGGVTVGGATGQIGSATDFDGTDDYLYAATSTLLDVNAGDFTLQSWLASDVTAFQPYFNKGIRGGTDRAYGLDTHSSPDLGAIIQDSDATNDYIAPLDGGSYSTGTWKKHDATFDRSANLTLYNDGTATGTPLSLSTQTTNFVTTTPLFIGCRTTTGANRITFYNGKLQALRLRKEVLTANWLSTEYNNQSAPATFWSYNAPAGGVTNNALSICNF